MTTVRMISATEPDLSEEGRIATRERKPTR